MGILSPVVQIAALPVNNIGEHDPFGGTVTPKFVGDNDAGFAPSTAKQLPKEALRRKPVSVAREYRSPPRSDRPRAKDNAARP